MNGARILLVIGNAHVLGLCGDLFVATGARISATRVYEQGIAWSYLFHPDLVILDLDLVRAEYRPDRFQTDLAPHLPILMLTTFEPEIYRASGLNLDRAWCLVKPVHGSVLLATAQTVLSRKRPRRRWRGMLKLSKTEGPLHVN